MRDILEYFPNFRHSLLNILERLWHFPALSFREEECEEAGGDGHHGEDQGRDGGVDVSQGGHRGGEGPAYLGDQGGGTHSCSSHCGRHKLSWQDYYRYYYYYLCQCSQ